MLFEILLSLSYHSSYRYVLTLTKFVAGLDINLVNQHANMEIFQVVPGTIWYTFKGIVSRNEFF
jgi:hypothetical protein